jgi:hypothetical protein
MPVFRPMARNAIAGCWGTSRSVSGVSERVARNSDSNRRAKRKYVARTLRSSPSLVGLTIRSPSVVISMTGAFGPLLSVHTP